MKRRWRCVLLTATLVLVALGLLIIGSLVWLHASGRLVTLAQHLAQHLSGQNVHIDAIEFPAWNMVAFTGIRLQQQVGSWDLEMICPRLEARYGLRGLLNKHVEQVRLLQPQVHVQASAVPPAPPSPASTSPMRPLPVKRLAVQQGTVHLRWHEVTYAVRQLDITLQQQQGQEVAIVASGTLAETMASFRLQGHTPLDRSQPAGSWQLTTRDLLLSQLAQTFPDFLPATWTLPQGKLDTDAHVVFQAQTLQGTLHTTISDGQVESDGLALHDLALTSEMTFEARPSQKSLRVQGTLHMQVAHATGPMAFRSTRLMLDTPLRLDYTPEQWQASADLAWQSDTLQGRDGMQIQQLAGTVPLRLQSTRTGWELQGTTEITASTARLRPSEQEPVQWQFDDIQVRLPLLAQSTTVESRDAQITMQARQWWAANSSPLPLTLQVSSELDLQQQRLRLQDVTITLGDLGSGHGSAIWAWAEHTWHDLQLQFTPTAVETLWSNLAPLIPAAYHAWQVQGQTRLEVQVPHLSLQSSVELPHLTMIWHVHNAAFSAPDGSYASEHVNGSVHVTVSHPDSTAPYTLQGTLTLQPFALLIGTFFPALEANHITSVVTFTGAYQSQTERLQLYIAGQFSDLGTITLQGQVYRPLSALQYDLRCDVQQLNTTQLWNTFIRDTGLVSAALASASVDGRLKAQLQLRDQATATLVEGRLDLTDFQLHSTAFSLTGASLHLPLQIRYPLPAPPVTPPPADAYGDLHIAQLSIGAAQIKELTTQLALRSDSVFFPEVVTLSLLEGVIGLRHLTAQYLLRPQRHIQFHMDVQHLNLAHLQRDTDTLPLAGTLHGAFTQVQLRGDRLETVGTLELQIAGGRIRITDMQGSHLFSLIPTWHGSFATVEPLSLLQLTRIYPIGDISGTVHITVDDLTVTAGELAAFRLTFRVQEKQGEEREITLRALNNLLFTTGSVKVAADLLGEAYRLPYRYFGAEITLRQDTLQLRGLYHDSKGREYFMRAPTFGAGVSIVNRVPENGIPFRDFLQRLQATVMAHPDVKVR